MNSSLSELLTPYVFSGHTGLWIVTNENERTQEEVQHWTNENNINCLRWDIGLGLIDTDGKAHGNSVTPEYPLNIQMIMKEKGSPDDRSIVLLHNFHRYLESPKVMQLLANALHLAKEEKITFLVLSPIIKIPLELERAFVILDHPLPVKEDMVKIFQGFEGEEEPDELVYKAAKGLTHLEIENAFALSLRKHGKIIESEVWKAKVQTIKRKGFLEIWEGTETFENLGGLHGLKDFTKRLLRPENSIPARGILLVGVPGSGKSAFIKALGNEVHRPVLQMDVGRLHAKYVGESVAGWEEILILDPKSNLLTRTTFKDLYESKLNNYSTLTCSDSSCHEGKGSSTIQHAKMERNLIKVTTQSGRSITVTKDHSLFTVSPDGLSLLEKACGDLKIGDQIAVAGKIDFPIRKTFPVIPLKQGCVWIANVDHLSSEEIASIVGKNNVTHYKKNGISVSRMMLHGKSILTVRLNKHLDSPSINVTEEQEITSLDCRILGYWLANGDINKASIRIHLHKQDAIEVQEALNGRWKVALGQPSKGNGQVIYINSGAKGYYDSLYGFELNRVDCYTKRLPPIVFQFSPVLRAEVLSAYLCADGHFGYHGIEVTTASSGLANDILLLMSSLGIIGVVTKSNDLYRVRIQGTQQLKTVYSLLSFAGYSRKKKVLEEAINNRDHTRKERSCTRPDHTVNSPFSIDKVQSIECVQLGEEDYVYDISVPKYQKFLTGFGGVWAHNSEANIREALKIADSMAPCILYLDEVEKALSGVGGEGDSGVSTRVFGTLLTWLNDHETDVFTACSANDVNRLPAEFSRAERFDRQFMLDLPSLEERNAIWSIYREKYQISPNSIPPAEDKDWTGAEIKACCRLARSLDCSLFEAARGLVPVATSMGERIQALREWANGRVTSANTGEIYSSSLDPLELTGKKRKVTK